MNETVKQDPPRPPVYRRRGFWIVVVALLGLDVLISVSMYERDSEPRVEVPFSPYFLSQVDAGAVESITATGDSIEGTFTRRLPYPPDDADPTRTTRFSTEVPSFWDDQRLTNLLRTNGVEINADSESSGNSLLPALLFGFGPTLLLVGVFVLLTRRASRASGSGVLGTFGRSQARRVDPTTITVTFDDVAGIDEAKAELAEIVDFLRTPDRYVKLGGRIPHGVLLYGPPGTGKTLLARAIAGEAHAAFFSIAASEFIEAIVGVGASRVRDLFAKAKAAAPSIIFIDELDAVGRSRQGASGLTGANDEREQTLNQILTEMDGFESSEAVVVLGATNRPEVLDRALLRPGRFDRRIAVQPPDRTGRRRILDVHTHGMPLDDDVDLDAIAASTPGMVGADLANVANEAALLAARRRHDRISMADFTRLARQDPARRAARNRPASLRSGADRVPRGGARPRRHVDARGRPRPPGDDHSARYGPRCHTFDARRRPCLVYARRTPRPDRGRARRARRRGDRVRHDHDRRGVRHRTAHPPRPPHRRALGHERGVRADRTLTATTTPSVSQV